MSQPLAIFRSCRPSPRISAASGERAVMLAREMIVTDVSQLLGETDGHALGAGDAVARSAALSCQVPVVADQSAAVCRRQLAPGRPGNFSVLTSAQRLWYLVYHRPVGASSIG
jgi:hypothetical protein